MFEISKRFRFEAAHSLPHLPKGHKCRRVHGHSYEFDVVCRGDVDDRGFVIDYAEISEAVEPIVAMVDHQNLNELFGFYTTAEMLAKWIYDQLQGQIPVSHILFYETKKTSVRYPA